MYEKLMKYMINVIDDELDLDGAEIWVCKIKLNP